jgi:phenylalanyl-tRNA synthetase beta chain
MACSTYELGIDEDHEGIILLEDEAPVGTPLADYMGDIVLEVEVTPNMARCLSLIGVAREVAALSGPAVTLPATEPKATGAPIEGLVRVRIADAKLSPRYAAGLLRDVKIGPAPGWMQRRLTYAGMRPINNVVDVTNYVMLEWGQPLHAFDYDRLVARAGGKAPTIIVRPARAGETLRTLDGNDRKLTPDMLVIADEAGPIALAGIMGGAETEVSAATTSVLLESASFDFVSIRRTMRALDLPSEASARFSRGIHPEVVLPALGRACELMRLHAGATVCKGVADVYPAPLTPQVIDLSMKEVRRLLGLDIPREECARILSALEFKVQPVGEDALRAVGPPHRLDIQAGPADLIEDLIRVVGYDKLPATLLADELPRQATNEPLAFEERLRDLLVSLGLQEVVTYSLTTPEREAPLSLPAADYVRLLNPISSERVVMRHSVLAGVLEVLAANLRHDDDVRLFEVGSVYLPRPGERLPDEPRRLAVALCGRRRPEFWGEPGQEPVPLDFFDLKGVVEGLADGLHLSDVTFRKAATPYLHPGRSAEVLVGGRSLGNFGELHPKVGAAFGLDGRQVLAGELDVEALREAAPQRWRYRPVPRFPAALRDVALVVEESVPAERVEAEIRAAGGELLRGLRLFDLYRGDTIAAGHKSLAYALTYQADDRTLTDKEIEKAHNKVKDRLRHVLKAEIREPKKG